MTVKDAAMRGNHGTRTVIQRSRVTRHCQTLAGNGIVVARAGSTAMDQTMVGAGNTARVDGWIIRSRDDVKANLSDLGTDRNRSRGERQPLIAVQHVRHARRTRFGKGGTCRSKNRRSRRHAARTNPSWCRRTRSLIWLTLKRKYTRRNN